MFSSCEYEAFAFFHHSFIEMAKNIAKLVISGSLKVQIFSKLKNILYTVKFHPFAQEYLIPQKKIFNRMKKFNE